MQIGVLQWNWHIPAKEFEMMIIIMVMYLLGSLLLRSNAKLRNPCQFTQMFSLNVDRLDKYYAYQIHTYNIAC